MTDEDAAAWRLENLKGAVALGGQTIKSLELVNGGAVIAVLTLFGHLTISGHAAALDRKALVCALGWFAIGVALAVSTSIAGYLSQLGAALADGRRIWLERLDEWGRYFALGLGFGSLLAFLAGVFHSASAFR